MIVLTFATSDVPIGINLPNYDDIRQKCGFKNVNLGNAYSLPEKNSSVPFLNESDNEIVQRF